MLFRPLPPYGARFRSRPVDWLVDVRQREVLELVPVVDRRISVDTGSAGSLLSVVGDLRRARYDVALDLQGLLKSAVLARLSGAARVIGFPADLLRERAARFFYTETAGDAGASCHRQKPVDAEGRWHPYAGDRVSARGSKSGDRERRARASRHRGRARRSPSSIQGRHGRTSDGRLCISRRLRKVSRNATVCDRSCCGDRAKNISRRTS